MGGLVADGTAPGDGWRAQAIALVRAEAAAGAPIDRLCRAAVRGLGLSGALTMVATSPATQLTGSSDQNVARIAELEFELGEGPSTDATVSRRPVLVPDLSRATRWPAYARFAMELGTAGVFALPLHVGAVHLGVLVLASDEVALLDGDRMAFAFAFAELATEILLDGDGDGVPPDSTMAAILDAHSEVYQAQGMVMVQLGVSLADALANLRARAFLQSRDLTELARDVLSGRERFERDG
ncbi:GAF and ANTAR domain-containing protein [Solicola gregarius]|uniref:GAF and ANTAR domain-containing protein n=1 Tax=Solicola gregarius TaxID=2908642 RepID=A0AA46YLL8_9ACTN|nr:GAF and ANTAR domain-containing protein [Solicola gregarius]UYM05636.1 GAF and ANTAR domain-containing protein [Solicola gregarius]